MLLGVNIDHVATLRQVRGTTYPDPLEAARVSAEAGADSITVHLREDKRHIQQFDVENIANQLSIPLNLEIAVTDEMITFAEQLKPDYCCFVPEKRQELTTEGGLNVAADIENIKQACKRLASAGIQVSLFIDADKEQIEAARMTGAPCIEIHTGHYADAETNDEIEYEKNKIIESVAFAKQQGLRVHAGHGLTLDNVTDIAAIPGIVELNIGHSIVARAVMIGLAEAVREMREQITSSND